jgi:hypothetical protein
LRGCLSVAPMELTVQLRDPVRPVAARSRAHPVPVVAECQLRHPHDRDQPQDPMSVHLCLSVAMSEWMSPSSASDVEIV